MKKQTLLLAGAQLAGVGIQAVTIVVLARLIDPTQFGAFSVVAGVAAFCVVIADFGMQPLLLRASARREYGLVAGALRLNLISTLALGAAGACATAALTQNDASLLPLSLLFFSLCVEKNVDTQLAVEIAAGRASVAAANLLIRRGASATVFVSLALADVAPIAGFCIAALIGATTAWGHVRIYRLKTTRHDAEAATETLRQALPFLLSNVGAQARTLDAPIVAAIAGTSQAGFYGSAMRLANPVLIASGSIVSTIVPHTVQQGVRHARVLAIKMTALHVGMAVALLTLGLLSPIVVGVLYGPAYLEAAPVLTILLGSVPFIGLSSVLGAVLQAHGYERMVAILGLGFALITLCGVAGAATNGAVGAALALGVAYLAKCFTLLLFLLLRKDLRSGVI